MARASSEGLISVLVVAGAALASAAAAVDEPFFANGFETGTTCPWSATAPAITCPEFETCVEATTSVWGCFEMPYEASPRPAELGDAGGVLVLQHVDAYFLIDRSGSMTAELSDLASNLSTVVSSVQCAPMGTGTPPDCIPDLWAGGGVIGYSGTGSSPYSNTLDVGPTPGFAALPTSEDPLGCCDEATLLAAWATVTGQGSTTSGCVLSASFGGRATCDGSPAEGAGYATRGYPCFRAFALPVIFVYTDEGPTDGLDCPLILTVIDAANALGAKLVGMVGGGATAQTTADLTLLATGTGAVDTSNGDAPLVFSAADANAASATSSALLTLHAGAPLESVSARFVDGDPGDGIDLESIWLDSIEAIGGGADCLTPIPATDTNADGLPDTYTTVSQGTRVCWKVAVNENSVVPGTSSVQLFEASLEVVAGDALLETLPLVFLVPVG